MIDCGLNEREVEQLRSVFASYPQIETVVVFGSRAKGTARCNSDVDLAITGKIDTLMMQRIQMELDDLPLPYTFDVVALESVASPDLLRHISRVGALLYQGEALGEASTEATIEAAGEATGEATRKASIKAAERE